MQKHIATWELLAQFAFTVCVESKLPPGHPPVICRQGADNSAADASAAKGITMTPGMSQVLSQYFLFMRRCQVYSEITHIPGHLKTTADAISRFEPLQTPLDPLGMVEINWLDLLYQDGIQVSQPRNQFLPRFESARLKKIFESRLYFWGVRLPAGRNSICFGMWSNYPPPTLSRSLDLPADGL